MEYYSDNDLILYNKTNVNNEVKRWLAKYFGTSIDNVSDMLNTQNATVYLLVWPIMEQNMFDGFMTQDKISHVSEEMGTYFDKLGADHILKHFYARYQDDRLCHNLLNPQNKRRKAYMDTFEELVKRRFEDLSGEDKMTIMMTVIYRYRNNIFHGNKAIDNWHRYSNEIAYCTEFMMLLVNKYKELHMGVEEK